MKVRADHATLCIVFAVIGACGDAGARYKVKDFCDSNPDSRMCNGGGGGGGDGTDQILLPEFYKLATGVWKSACVVSREYPPAFSTDTLRFEDKDVFKRTYELYSDNNCKARLLAFSDTGSVSIRKKAGADMYNVVFTLEKSTLMPTSTAGVSILAESETCKRTNWAPGQQEDLSQCLYVFHAEQPNEESFAFAGLEWFEFVTLTGKEIFLSKKSKAEMYFPKSDLAPTASDDTFPYRKQ